MVYSSIKMTAREYLPVICLTEYPNLKAVKCKQIGCEKYTNLWSQQTTATYFEAVVPVIRSKFRDSNYSCVWLDTGIQTDILRQI